MELIKEDKKLFYRIIGTLNDFMPYLDEVKRKFEECSGFTFTVDTWREIKNGNLQQIKDDVLSKVNDELSRSGVENTILRNQAVESIANRLPEFEETARQLLNYRPSKDYPVLTVSDINFSGKSFFVSEETQEQIREKYCRLYLNEKDDIAMELYEYANRIAETATKLRQRLKAGGMFIHPYNDAWILGFITDKGDGYEAHIPEINHVAKAIRKNQ